MLALARACSQLDEVFLRYVICESSTHDGIHTEILDAHQTCEQAELEVLGIDRGDLDLAALELGLDDGCLTFDDLSVCFLRATKPRAARHAHDNEHFD